MIQLYEGPGFALRSYQWLRIGVVLIGALGAASFAPLLIPNRAFQLIAGASAAIIIWDYRLILEFYVAMASQTFGRLRARIRQPRAITLPGLLFCGILIWLLFNVVIRPVKVGILRYETTPVLLGAVLLLLVLPSIYAAAVKAGSWFDSKPKPMHRIFVFIVLSVFFSAQFTIAKAIYLFPGWDAGAVLENAIGLAQGSQHSLNADYFGKYPNNIFLTLMLAAFNRVMLLVGVSDLLLASIVFNLTVLLFGILLIYLVARRLAGTGAAIFSLLPSSVFVVVSPWIAVPYSDTFGLLVPVLLIYLFIKSKDATNACLRIGLWVAIGLVGLIGYNIKPTVIFVLASIAAVTLIHALAKLEDRSHLWSRIASVLVALGVFAAGSAALTQLERNAAVIPFDVTNNPNSVPFTHFLKMGATGSGGYNEEDVQETFSIADPQERFRNGLHVYRQRVEAMGPIGYADFLSRKGTWTFGDGTFGMWYEGVVAAEEDPFISKDPVSRSIQEYLWLKGSNFPFMTALWQSSWLVVLFLVAAPIVLRGNKMFGSAACTMRMSLLGLLLFQLFFETRARYLYLFVPFFILLAVLTLDTVVSRMASGLAAEKTALPPYSRLRAERVHSAVAEKPPVL